MMNYHEVSVTDPLIRDRLTLGEDSSDKLCGELARMTIVNQEKPASGGIFSRLKSTLFSGGDSLTAESQYVASCRVKVPSTGVLDKHLHLCVNASGVCKLLRYLPDSSPAAAIELSSVSVASGGTGSYSVSSVYLGSTQGSLCVCSVGGGRMVVLSVLGEKLSVSKTFTLAPLPAHEISSICLHVSSKLVELYVVFHKFVLVVPDITKSHAFSFVYVCERAVQQLELSTITDETLRVVYESLPISPAPLRSTQFRCANFDEFRNVFLGEKISQIAHVNFQSVFSRVCKFNEMDLQSVLSSELSSLCVETPRRLVSLDSRVYSIRGSKVCEIVGSTGLEMYVNTFQSVPIVGMAVTTRDTVGNFFGGSLAWKSVFAAASVGESLSPWLWAIDVVPASKISSFLDSLSSEIKAHISAVIPARSNDLFERLIRPELALPATPSRISALHTMMRYLYVYEIFQKRPISGEFFALSKKLKVAHLLQNGGVVPVQDFLSQMHVYALDVSAEIGYLVSLGDVSWSNFAHFHEARLLGKFGECEKALALFEKCQMELSLYLKSDYWKYVCSAFSGNYEWEMKVWRKHLVSPQKDTREFFEKAVSNGDWATAKEFLPRDPNMRQECIRLMCSEARIRNELNQIFAIVKDNKNLVSLIIEEIETDLKIGQNNGEEIFSNYLQIYTLSLFVENFKRARECMVDCSNAFRTGFFELERFDISDETVEFLNFQLKALVLARSIDPSAIDLENEILCVEGLLALFSYYSLDDYQRLECPTREFLCKSLSALGLVLHSAKISAAYKLDLFSNTILPYVLLIQQGEAPPCRIEGEGTGDVSTSMAFVRCDKTGPIGTGGDQIRAMTQSLQFVLQSCANIHCIIDTARCFDPVPAWLTNLAEERRGWTLLLAIHMQRENWRECVRLVETHVKFWRPNPLEVPTDIINVPLLVQLQRALSATDEENSENSILLERLDSALEILKNTLHDLTQRI